jgi:hypothetical protein
MGKTSEAKAVAGVSDHSGWEVVVCIADNTVFDVRRIELIEPGLPNFAYHHAAQNLPIGKAVALVERVHASAALCARNALSELPTSVGVIAIRKRPTLPSTVAERITNYWAQTRADSVRSRDVLAEAAKARGWFVHEFDAKTVFADAANVLGLDDISVRMKEIGEPFGPPWNKDHKLATAAAVVAADARQGDK